MRFENKLDGTGSVPSDALPGLRGETGGTCHEDKLDGGANHENSTSSVCCPTHRKVRDGWSIRSEPEKLVVSSN